MLKDFKEFAMKGNVLDLATGVIIGGAFGKIVTSLVNDIIMPLIGLILGGRSFEARQLLLRQGVEEGTDLILQYGAFMQSIVDFVIIAFSIFIFIRLITKLQKAKKVEEEIIVEEEATPTNEELLLIEIRDLLKNQSL
ncbi:MAG TPA: large-conductance mechanosensitive channel protein MscL [Epulopiscium sp.]|nr:large-conductance mechanosensitive channel protein MscL [Candidatus Epulonipiscium sp.]